MFMYILLYLFLGAVYLYIKSMIDDTLNYWSPVQPLFVIVGWPIVLTIDILNRIK